MAQTCLPPAQHRYNVSEKGRARQVRFEERRQLHVKCLRILRLAVGCVDCGYREDPTRLHFHHIVFPKKFSVMNAANRSLSVLMEEIEKCVVLCNPCHGRRHGA